MKINNSEDSKKLYYAPECEVLTMGVEGLICASGSEDLTGNIDPWKNGNTLTF